MDIKLLHTLKTLDNSQYYASLHNFNFKQAIEFVKKLKSKLKKIAGHSFVLHEHIRDTTFFADLSIEDRQTDEIGKTTIYTVLGIRFSCFGNLFTIWSNSTKQLDKDKIKAIIEAVEASGFVYVDIDSLDEPYLDENNRYSGSWWDRYFEYLPT